MKLQLHLLPGDPLDPSRLDGYYFRAWCPSVRHNKKENHAIALKQNTLQQKNVTELYGA